MMQMFLILFVVFHGIGSVMVLIMALLDAKSYSIKDEPHYMDYTEERAKIRQRLRLWWFWELLVYRYAVDALLTAKFDSEQDELKLRTIEMKKAREQLRKMNSEDQLAWLQDFHDTVNRANGR